MTLQNYRSLCLKHWLLLINKSFLRFYCYSLVVCCLYLVLVKIFVPISFFYQLINTFNSNSFSVFFFSLVFSNLILKLSHHFLELCVILHFSRWSNRENLRSFNVIFLILELLPHRIFLFLFKRFE